MIIWLYEKIHNNTISVCVPIIGDDLIKSIRDKVIKYQVHKCILWKKKEKTSRRTKKCSFNYFDNRLLDICTNVFIYGSYSTFFGSSFEN